MDQVFSEADGCNLYCKISTSKIKSFVLVQYGHSFAKHISNCHCSSWMHPYFCNISTKEIKKKHILVWHYQCWAVCLLECSLNFAWRCECYIRREVNSTVTWTYVIQMLMMVCNVHNSSEIILILSWRYHFFQFVFISFHMLDRSIDLTITSQSHLYQ